MLELGVIGKLHGHVEVPPTLQRTDRSKPRRLNTRKRVDAFKQRRIEGLNQRGATLLLWCVKEQRRVRRKVHLTCNHLAGHETRTRVAKGEQRTHHQSSRDQKRKRKSDLTDNKRISPPGLLPPNARGGRP